MQPDEKDDCLNLIVGITWKNQKSTTWVITIRLRESMQVFNKSKFPPRKLYIKSIWKGRTNIVDLNFRDLHKKGFLPFSWGIKATKSVTRENHGASVLSDTI